MTRPMFVFFFSLSRVIILLLLLNRRKTTVATQTFYTRKILFSMALFHSSMNDSIPFLSQFFFYSFLYALRIFISNRGHASLDFYFLHDFSFFFILFLFNKTQLRSCTDKVCCYFLCSLHSSFTVN